MYVIIFILIGARYANFCVNPLFQTCKDYNIIIWHLREDFVFSPFGRRNMRVCDPSTAVVGETHVAGVVL